MSFCRSEPPSGARAILDAACELFASQGFDAVSISAIAQRAGVSKSNVFHHFANKEALFAAVLQESGEPHADFVEALLAQPGSSMDKLRQLVMFEMQSMFENDRHMRVVMREMIEDGQDGRCERIGQVFQRNIDGVLGLIRQGQARGEFRSDLHPAVASLLLCGAMHQFFRCHQMVRYFAEELEARPEPRSLMEYGEDIFKMVSAGLAAMPATAAMPVAGVPEIPETAADAPPAAL